MASRLIVGWGFTLAILLSATGCGQSAPADATAQIAGGPATEDAAASTNLADATQANFSQGSSAKAGARKPEGDPLHPIVEIQTTLGKITLELDAEHAPGTVRNFLNYVNAELYNSTIFHYVDAGSMILGGGFDDQLSPIQISPPIRNEAHNGLRNLAGTIAMSRPFDAIDGATSQFFINVRDNSALDHSGPTEDEYGYTVFGKVTAGMEVVEQISQIPVHTEGEFTNTPKQRVIVEAVRFVK